MIDLRKAALHIRPAVVGEVAELSALALRSKAHWGYDASQIEAWRASLEIHADSLAAQPTFVGERAGRVAGFYSLLPAQSQWHLEHFWVAPEHVRRGIGRALLSHALQTATEGGAIALHIDADPNAERFYLACGAIRIGEVAAPIAGQAARVRPQLLLTDYILREAGDADAAGVAACVHAAYRHYVERIGRPPGPMTEDYAKVVRERKVTVAESRGRIVGVLVLSVTDEGFLLENIAVDPSHRGLGLGRVLLEVAEAEARREGFDSLYLYTHEKMTENQALYAKIGYAEYDRRSEKGLARVYMRKSLLPRPGGRT